MAITHNKVSAKADGGDSSLVLPSDWNAAHVGQPSSISDFLDDTAGGTDALTTKAPTSNALYDVAHALPNRNAIINGAGIVNQRVTAFSLVKDTYGIAADRFYGMATGTAVSAGTFNNIATANCGVSGYAFKFIAVTLTGTGVLYFRYRMEAKDAIRFKNQTASFRCQVYQDTGGAINYTIYVRKPTTTADTFSAVTAISNSGAISVPNTTATSLPYLAIAMGDCSKGIEIEIKVECGAITTKNFEFTDIQFELGSVATPFEFRPYGQELELCQRYYEETVIGTHALLGTGYIALTTDLYASLYYVRKRATPTVTFSAVDDFEVIWYGGVTAASGIVSDLIYTSSCRLGLTTAAVLATGQAGFAAVADSVNGTIKIDSEL